LSVAVSIDVMVNEEITLVKTAANLSSVEKLFKKEKSFKKKQNCNCKKASAKGFDTLLNEQTLKLGPQNGKKAILLSRVMFLLNRLFASIFFQLLSKLIQVKTLTV